MIVATTMTAMIHFAVVHPARFHVRVVHCVVVYARATLMLLGTVGAAVTVMANVLQGLLFGRQFVVNTRRGSRLVLAMRDRLKNGGHWFPSMVFMGICRHCWRIHDVERTHG